MCPGCCLLGQSFPSHPKVSISIWSNFALSAMLVPHGAALWSTCSKVFMIFQHIPSPFHSVFSKFYLCCSACLSSFFQDCSSTQWLILVFETKVWSNLQIGRLKKILHKAEEVVALRGAENGREGRNAPRRCLCGTNLFSSRKGRLPRIYPPCC